MDSSVLLATPITLHLPRKDKNEEELRRAMALAEIDAIRILDTCSDMDTRRIEHIYENTVRTRKLNYRRAYRALMSAQISRFANEGHFDNRITPFVASRFGARVQQSLMVWLLRATPHDRRFIQKEFFNGDYLMWQYRGAITASRVILELLRSDIPVYLPPLNIDIFHAVDLIAGPFPNGKLAGIQIKSGPAQLTVVNERNAQDSESCKKVLSGCEHILRTYSLKLAPIMLSIPCTSMFTLSTTESRKCVRQLIDKSRTRTRRTRRAS